MAKEKHYKIYTLYANVTKVLGNKDGKEVTRTDRVPFAVFTDEKKCSEYTKKSTYKLKGQKSWEVGTDLVEVEPKAEDFALPFNPLPDASKEEANAKDNGTH